MFIQISITYWVSTEWPHEEMHFEEELDNGKGVLTGEQETGESQLDLTEAGMKKNVRDHHQ